jgi:hypothetical protein
VVAAVAGAELQRRLGERHRLVADVHLADTQSVRCLDLDKTLTYLTRPRGPRGPLRLSSASVCANFTYCTLGITGRKVLQIIMFSYSNKFTRTIFDTNLKLVSKVSESSKNIKRL